MPRAYEVDFIFQSYKASGTDMTAWLESFIQKTSTAYIARKKLKRVCHLVINEARERRDAPERVDRTAKTSFTDALLGMVVQASVHLRDSVLCKLAMRLVQEELPQRAIVQAIQQFGLRQIEQE